MNSVRLKSDDIHCDACAASVARAISAVAGVQAVDVDLPTRTVAVSFEPPADEGAIRRAMGEAGFAVAAGP